MARVCSACGQRCFTFVNKTKFKMASLSLEEVLEEVCLKDQDSRVEEEEEEIEEGDPEESALDKQIEVCLNGFDCLVLDRNLDAFKDSVRRYIKGSYHAFKPPSDPLKVLLNTGINCGSVLVAESKLWLEKIGFRLTGKTSIRNPYRSEIIRNIPLEVFLSLERAVRHSRKQEIANNVTHCENKKGHVMSFTSRKAVVLLLSMLSGLSETSVLSHFKRRLTGNTNGKAKVIVNSEKDFAFVYKIKPGQFIISFQYGVWNKAGFPLHA